MHHCVERYNDKSDSLILSARIADRRVETVEVSLSRLQVVQSRGACNRNTEYHDRIVRLVNDNMSLVRAARHKRDKASPCCNSRPRCVQQAEGSGIRYLIRNRLLLNRIPRKTAQQSCRCC